MLQSTLKTYEWNGLQKKIGKPKLYNFEVVYRENKIYDLIKRIFQSILIFLKLTYGVLPGLCALDLPFSI